MKMKNWMRIIFGYFLCMAVFSANVKAENKQEEKHELRAASYGSRVTDHEMRSIVYGSRVTNDELRDTALRVTNFDCVKYAVYNSFEVKLAKLDLYIEETGLMLSEAVFDTFLYGGISYEEDKRQQLSVFAADDGQTNVYYGGLEKTLPTGTELSAEITDTRLWNNTAFVSKNPSHEGKLTFEAKQPIGRNTFGYVDRANISLTKLSIENAGMDAQDRIEVFIVNVEKAYIDLIFAKRSYDIFKDMLGKAGKLYETAKKNYDVGLAEKIDLLASQANVSTMEAETRLTENNYRRAEADLKFFMNVESAKRIIPEGKLEFKPVKKSLSDCLEKAFDKRRDYETGKKNVEIKGLDLKIKDNEKWPEVDLTLSIAMNGLEQDFDRAMGKTTVADNTYYYAGIEVMIPIENKAAQSNLLKAKNEKEKVLVLLKEIERKIVTEVGEAWGDATAFAASLVHMSDAVKFQAEKLSEEEKRFTYGRSGTKKLIDCQRDLLLAQLEEARHYKNHMKAKVDLDRSMNVILDKYEELL